MKILPENVPSNLFATHPYRIDLLSMKFAYNHQIDCLVVGNFRC